ncbi:hypothetical protein PDJAM_G00058260 [Pangasius djambal]|uniref:Uncharacterized protein n=1 Tax=Pangasius djambal TaxID=1691987 RepID=A0ACC5YYF9_9TELE|nr:hypothetical protein [Pangasius djambal]
MFCRETSGPGIHVDVTLTHTTYLNTVADQVHSFMATLSSNGSGLFQQDSAPCHTAKIIQEWFEEHDKEHLWDVLDKQVGSVEARPRNCGSAVRLKPGRSSVLRSAVRERETRRRETHALRGSEPLLHVRWPPFKHEISRKNKNRIVCVTESSASHREKKERRRGTDMRSSDTQKHREPGV